MSTEAASLRSGRNAVPTIKTSKPALGTLAASVQPGSRVLPEDARSHHRALVLRALYRNSGMSRADLAREVGLTRVTMSDLVGDLLTQGLVVELGVRSASGPGKPATLIDINRTGFTLVALDLSQDHRFTGILTDLDGNVVHRQEVSVKGVVGDAAVAACETLLAELLEHAQTPVLGVGVGTPGVVDGQGNVLAAPNLGWQQVPLQEILSSRTSYAVHVVNDANAAVLAERTLANGSADIMLVRMGRGVGAGLVINGQPVAGADSAAGEIGHVVVGTDQGELCACGRYGCLETWLAVPRLQARLAAAHDEAEQVQIRRNAGERLGIILAPVVGALNLSEVVVSGPLAEFGGELIESAAETLRQRALVSTHGDVAVRMTALGDDIVALGAAVTVLSGQLGIS